MSADPVDVVVVLPGITGSTLYRDGKPIWEPSAGAIVRALFTLGGSLRSLMLPHDLGDAHPGDGVEPRALVEDVHVIPGIWTPIKGYDKLVGRLESLGYRRPTADAPGNLLPMPYDWRLSNRYTADWLAPKVQSALDRWRGQGGRYADAKLVFVCHSMGGLIARWYAAHHATDGHVGKIVTLGTPTRGSMNAVDQLVHGAPATMGPLRGLITDLGRSLPSLHQLLPSYACVVGAPGAPAGGAAEPTHLDPSALADTDTEMARDGLAFHAQLEAAEAAIPGFADRVHLVVGSNQPTQSTVRFDAGQAILLDSYGTKDYRGDATVPLVGAVPAGVSLSSNTLHYVPDNHGNLQRNSAALDQVEGILKGEDVVIKGLDDVELSVRVPELVAAGQILEISVALPPGRREGLHATLRPAGAPQRGSDRETRVLNVKEHRATARFEDLAPGGYVIDVTGSAAGSPVRPVSAATLVWDPEATP